MNNDNLNGWLTLIGADARARAEELSAEILKMRGEGKVIYPAQENIFNTLRLVRPDGVKAVILGQDPYHEPDQAMGLAFSVPDGVKPPPSLRNIFKELADDVGCAMPKSGDLTRWAEQGVLLLNTVLTVEAHKANSHKKLGWQEITSKLLMAVAAQSRPAVFLCWGAQADKTLADVIDGAKATDGGRLILRATHPSPLSARKSTEQYPAFIGSRPFSRANEWLTAHGEAPIDWALE